MSLVEKVAALWRCLFGASTQPPLADAVEKMRKAMGISAAAQAVAGWTECAVS